MAARAPLLAKLTRPKHFDALPRERLFARLDEARSRPIVWLCAPPGSGKSTLVATWIEARKLPHLWYQVDVADSDPATFMHYMRMAAQALLGKRAASLPLFASEPQQDLARFSRSFCRELFAMLPRDTVIVLDNFHEARSPPAQRNAFAQGLEELPEGINIVVLSRADPPAEFSRLVAGRRIARVDAEELRCTEPETEALMGSLPLDRATLARLQRQSDGWAAALVLLREHLSRPHATLEDSLGEGKEAIFQYFAGEIFSRARPENRDALMITAVLPSITEDEARALTGSDEAARLLDYLYRRRLFVDRRRGNVVTYHYHALFREFLLEQGRRRLSAEHRRDLAAKAAALIEQRGEPESALALYRDAGDWEAMRRLIGANALDWARHGRHQALSDWIEALPAALRDADPWLAYWLGRAWVFVQPERGQVALARAFEGFRQAGDLRGQALALNTIVTGTYYEWANFAPLDRWLPDFRRLLGDGAATLDRESELRLRSAYLVVLLFRAPSETALAECASRLDAIVDDEPDVNARLMAASTLFNYLNWYTKGDSAEGLVARVEPLLARADVTPLMQLWWRTHLAFWHYMNGRFDNSAEVTAKARDIAERYGLAAYLFEIDHAEASALISKGALTEAKAKLDAMERRLSPARRMDGAYLHHLKSMLQQRMGEHGAAVRSAERALTIGRESGLPMLQMPHFIARLGHARSDVGDREGALAALDEAVALASGADRWALGRQRDAVEIHFQLEAGEREAARAGLERLVAAYKSRGLAVFLRNRPELAAGLLDFALREGIEPEYVRMLITRSALAAPPGASEAWPFRLRIRALGGFELVRDGQPMRFAGKAQQRPLDLLKLVVALGGQDVESSAVTSALWPDADGAAAKTSFDTALFRLRKLLDVEGALKLAGGKLALAPDLVWTDVRAFHEALDAAQAASDRGADAQAIAGAARSLLAAYPGPLLGTEDATWVAKPRDALRARLLRLLLALGAALESARDWPTAIDVYRRGLEADNLAEPFYRGLMRSLAASGDQAEALVAYRRCRELLSVVLGLKPSAETERLYRDITSGALTAPALPGARSHAANRPSGTATEAPVAAKGSPAKAAATAEPTRRLAAIVVADVVGYTRLMERDESRTLQRLQAIRAEIVNPVTSRFRGRIVKSTGDGWLAEFASVTDAVRSSLDIQAAIARLETSTGKKDALELRIGVNLGEIIVEGDDVYGTGVNVAARLEGLAEPGGVLISGAVHEQVRAMPGLAFEDRGEHIVKNLSQPVRTWGVRAESTQATGGRARAVPGADEEERTSVAVLPFADMSAAGDQSYFADGIVDDVITGLARFKWLRVIARNSTFTYKGRPVDVRHVARDLGVRYVLEGSVRRSGRRVRITGQLIDAPTGSHVWADRFDGEMEDIFDLQDRMTESVIGAMEPELRKAEIHRARRKPPGNLDAYDLFLQALPHAYAARPDDNARAIALLEEANKLDPTFAPALAFRAWCYEQRLTRNWADATEGDAANAVGLARSALAAGVDDANAVALAGFVLLMVGREFDTGLAELRRAVTLNPNNAFVAMLSGWAHNFAGDLGQGRADLDRAHALSPNDPTAFYFLTGMGMNRLLTGDPQQAAEFAARSTAEYDAWDASFFVLAAARGLLGRLDEAREDVARLRSLTPGATISLYRSRLPWRDPQRFEVFAQGLRHAGLPE